MRCTVDSMRESLPLDVSYLRPAYEVPNSVIALSKSNQQGLCVWRDTNVVNVIELAVVLQLPVGLASVIFQFVNYYV